MRSQFKLQCEPCIKTQRNIRNKALAWQTSKRLQRQLETNWKSTPVTSRRYQKNAAVKVKIFWWMNLGYVNFDCLVCVIISYPLFHEISGLFRDITDENTQWSSFLSEHACLGVRTSTTKRLQNVMNLLDFLGPYSNTANSTVLAAVWPKTHRRHKAGPCICRAKPYGRVWSGATLADQWCMWYSTHTCQCIAKTHWFCINVVVEMKISPQMVVCVYEEKRGKNNNITIGTYWDSWVLLISGRNVPCVPCIYEANEFSIRFSWVGQFQDPKDDSTWVFVPPVPGALPRSNRNQ